MDQVLARRALPFRAVNRRGLPGYVVGTQRHHLLPVQLLSWSSFARLFDELGRVRVGFDDFRRNGLLLPATEIAAQRLALPLHRGPHRAYNTMVAERVGQIESDWSQVRRRCPETARQHALQRIDLLQKALRRRLLSTRLKPLVLNRFDRLGSKLDFAELDAMAESLWSAKPTFAIAA